MSKMAKWKDEFVVVFIKKIYEICNVLSDFLYYKTPYIDGIMSSER